MWLIVSPRKTSVKREETSNVTYRAECTCDETYGKQKEASQCERQNTRTSLLTPSQPVTSQNIQPTHKHGTLRAPRKLPFGGKYNEGPAIIACEKPTLTKQVHYFYWENFIDQNQVVCKFPPCTPLMMTVRWKTFRFFKKNKF